MFISKKDAQGGASLRNLLPELAAVVEAAGRRKEAAMMMREYVIDSVEWTDWRKKRVQAVYDENKAYDLLVAAIAREQAR